ncbi:MAG: hypothetical protein ACXWHG_14910 [Thermoanaerobaculia bacterium]
MFRSSIDDTFSARLSAALESTEFFIADQIRIPEVFLPDWPLEQDDHCWHQFSDTELTSDAADDAHDRTIAEFVAETERASTEGWKIFDPMHRVASRRQPSRG